MPRATRSLFARPWFLLLLALLLLPFVALTLFAQPAIDYDNAAVVARLGRWGAQWYWYQHWSGRFVAIGASTLANPLSYGPRPGDAPTGLWVLRGILLGLLLSYVLVQQQLWRALLPVLRQVPARSVTWGLGLAGTALGMNALSEPFTLLYWYSGAVNYLLPLLCALGFIAAALRALQLPPGAARRGWAGAAALALVGAVGGGEITLLTRKC